MSVFGEKQVSAAIGRIPSTSSKDIRILRERGLRAGIEELVAACDNELALRPVEFDRASALASAEMAQLVAEYDLVDAIRYAFKVAKPATPDEIRFLRWLHENPGGNYQQAVAAFGKGGLGLLMGHLVYERHGCFRKFMVQGEDQSSVLIFKDKSGSSVRYQLKPEAELVFLELSLLS